MSKTFDLYTNEQVSNKLTVVIGTNGLKIVRQYPTSTQTFHVLYDRITHIGNLQTTRPITFDKPIISSAKGKSKKSHNEIPSPQYQFPKFSVQAYPLDTPSTEKVIDIFGPNADLLRGLLLDEQMKIFKARDEMLGISLNLNNVSG